MIKRLVDVVGAGAGLILLSPLLIALALWVRIDSPGPIFFRQERIGKRGRPFLILKFRSMIHAPGGSGPLITAGDDHRITRCGRHIRRAKLDELPQLFNVLMGDMSLVGPRPEVRRYVSLYSEGERQRILSVRPGLTDEASLEFSDEESILAAQKDPEDYYVTTLLPRKLRMYERYAANHTIIGDLRVIGRTICRVLKPTLRD